VVKAALERGPAAHLTDPLGYEHGDPASWPQPATRSWTGTVRYGTAEAVSWPELAHLLSA